MDWAGLMDLINGLCVDCVCVEGLLVPYALYHVGLLV